MPTRFLFLLLLLSILIATAGCVRKPEWVLMRCKGQTVECSPVSVYPTLKDCIAEARRKNFEYVQIGDIVKYGCAQQAPGGY